MKKYQYWHWRSAYVHTDSLKEEEESWNEIAGVLSGYGQDGWEVIESIRMSSGVSADGGSIYAMRFVLRREYV